MPKRVLRWDNTEKGILPALPFRFAGGYWRAFIWRLSPVAGRKVIVFVDGQNFYKGARRAFFQQQDPHICGQFHPIALGRLICSRALAGVQYEFYQVRVYTGSPDGSLDPQTYAAHRRQRVAWEKAGAVVIARPLKYPIDWPNSRPEQKGVDVVLAIDFIALAMDGQYEVGIIASTDTDLLPALEFVYKRYHPQRTPEVANWHSLSSRRRLTLTSANIWCHRLSRGDYNAIADPTDYRF